MHEAEHGLINISECEWPAFLYPPGTSPDVEDDQSGLFRGYLLIRVSVPFFFEKHVELLDFCRYFVKFSLVQGLP